MAGMNIAAYRDWALGRYRGIDNPPEMTSKFHITFSESFVGETYTVTNGTYTYTGTVTEELEIVIEVAGLETVYTCTCSTTTIKIQIGKYYIKTNIKIAPMFIYQDGYTDLISIFDGSSYNFSAFISTTVGDSFSSGGRGWTRASGDTAVVCNERWSSNYGGVIVFAKSLESLKYTSATGYGYQVHKVKDYNMYGVTLSGTWDGNTEVSFNHDNVTRNLANIAQYNYTLTNGDITNNELIFPGWENILETIETIVNNCE